MTHACEPSPGALGEPAAVLDREAWLFRRVTPDSHPLRDALRPCRSGQPVMRPPAEPHGGPAQPAAARPAPPAPQEARPAALLDDAEIARRIHELPPLPRALTEALRLVRSDALSADACVRAIEQDATLAARALRLANSPFYGACGRVSSVGDAVRLLGLRTVAGVVVAVSMRAMLANWRDEDKLFQAYWKHAVATGTAARELAAVAGADPDEAFLAGLLHDVGRLVLAVFVPVPARLARAQSLADDSELREAELRLIGRAHDDVGAAVARYWLLPEPIVAAIALHHAPSAAVQPGTTLLAAVVHVADAVAHGMDLADDPAEAVPPIDDAAWRLVSPPEGAMGALVERVTAAVSLMASDH
jgi:putative nucleotidyltransferase with HDIG domain